jgi:predicted nicotinamide N-methyase
VPSDADLAALARDLTAARGGRPPPAGMLDVVADRLAGVDFLRPRDWDLLCERDRDLPTWAIVWPSGAALAEAVAAAPDQVAGRRVLELGCGLGVASLVAARAGADVLATDAVPEALVFAAHNLRGTGARTARLDVRAPGEPGSFDVVMAADLLYDRGNVEPLLAAVPRLLAPGGEVWLADPGRPGLDALRAGAAERWRGIDLTIVLAPAPATHRRV